MNTQPTSHQSADTLPITAAYRVAGMTCRHCENAVASEIGSLAGVAGVRVDLALGGVTVYSDRPISRHLIEAAVDEAGCALL